MRRADTDGNLAHNVISDTKWTIFEFGDAPYSRPHSPPWRFHGVRRPQTTFLTENGRPQWTPRTRL
eukprot:COSAG02_NODE_12846_length_1483_cov_2.961705_3_plen_65_part_01